MIKIPEKNLAAAQAAHVQAIQNYIQTKDKYYQEQLFTAVTAVFPCESSFSVMREQNDWSWLQRFLLADVPTLRTLTQEKADALQFKQFLNLYIQRFSHGADTYVDTKTKYNSYSLLKNLGLTVCPYCDEEYLHILDGDDQDTVRTIELDHFFPKSSYPALALSFFNLVPSGQNCNGIKLKRTIGMSPFESDIEFYTKLYPDLPLVGVNMDTVPVEDCIIHFHPIGAMEQNVKVLRLEERYLNHRSEAHRYLTLKQNFNDEKLQEGVRMGFFTSLEQAKEVLYGEVKNEGNHKLLQKLKHDILGF